ncbi:hydrogenase maturation protease [Bacillus sp. HMF5848]|uniref:hydrogenase maturation protease n=1 Tax=Bacillus sp. HMF5848 TaxID=2495421 RepID=UPI000F778023|nr:hydrogenase maturation protease [Bacillus sp. HMF5848]RSK25909.1 hydrogenase maturation protease [Bacillus sp. HMF5848]
MKKIVVIGIGNQLMMDDGIGNYVVMELAKDNTMNNVEHIIGESDIDYCLERMEGATKVIIIDAICTNKTPGDVSVFPIENFLEQTFLSISAHDEHLFHMLKLKKDTVKGYVIGIEPAELQFNLGLSEILSERWNVIIGDVKKAIYTLI